ncbi:MAG: RsmD family RNA methyltransferase [Chitinophagaceae bacterium]|jgi:16S rRNA (guanine966-N2)-methyltransferase|nr:RsmD family RNA methyltransferase [Chitinophagaceae bacterium]MCE2973736.1 RsmD family RNA methyltransferase [Sediminibacterium sp.]MCA6487699.1 RsmD family RNA methyltransferase [Chitinophagaceae bacterium]MCA6489210.1 RsmD family RNA methyltransferase [Chitinophagaceae bacterium]MCA6492411.1 RsmD family RNA methyltransferase [Chitinophagaceae bacterium]
MRIISGKWGGRRIDPPAHMPHTRPTTDMAKEGLFNILSHRLNWQEIRILDLFGGTGAISYELASRGVPEMVIVEKDPTMHRFIENNLQKLGATGYQVLRMDVFAYLNSASQPFGFIFAGPPYALTTIDDLPTIIVNRNLIAPGGYFVLEHTPRNDYQQYPGFVFQRNYGTTVFSFFQRIAE